MKFILQNVVAFSNCIAVPDNIII